MASPAPQVYVIGPNGVAYQYRYVGAPQVYGNAAGAGPARVLLTIVVVILILAVIFIVIVWGPSWWRGARTMTSTKTRSTEPKSPKKTTSD